MSPFDKLDQTELPMEEAPLQVTEPSSVPDEPDELELLNYVESPEEFYKIVSLSPESYLPKLEKNPLFESTGIATYNLIQRRHDGNLMIKYKINPDERWTELGFYGDRYPDSEVYEEFKNHVTLRLARGLKNKNDRPHLVSELEEPGPQNMLDESHKFVPGQSQPIDEQELHKMAEAKRQAKRDDFSQRQRLARDRSQPPVPAPVPVPVPVPVPAPAPAPAQPDIPKMQSVPPMNDLLQEFKRSVYQKLCHSHFCHDARLLVNLLLNQTDHHDDLITMIVNLQQRRHLIQQLRELDLSPEGYQYCIASLTPQPVTYFLSQETIVVLDKYKLNPTQLIYEYLYDQTGAQSTHV